jgi:hypothetical protein
MKIKKAGASQAISQRNFIRMEELVLFLSVLAKGLAFSQ